MREQIGTNQRTLLFYIPLIIISFVPITIVYNNISDPRDVEYTNQWLDKASCSELKQYILQEYKDDKLYYFEGKAVKLFTWKCEK
jgi:hypothetical protein